MAQVRCKELSNHKDWGSLIRDSVHSAESQLGLPWEWTFSLLPRLLVSVHNFLSPLPSAPCPVLLPIGLSSLLWDPLGVCFLLPLPCDLGVCPSLSPPSLLCLSVPPVPPGSSGLHRDAVWPCSGRCVHHGLQLPAVCAAGFCHRPVQLRQQAGLRIEASACPAGSRSRSGAACLRRQPCFSCVHRHPARWTLGSHWVPGLARWERPLPAVQRQRSAVCMRGPECNPSVPLEQHTPPVLG